jgi:hypothetical protein
MNGKACIFLAILSLLVCTALQARDFREYGIGENVNAFPELSAEPETDSLQLYTAADEITQYAGIFTKNLLITADPYGYIISKAITLPDKDPEYATQVFQIWNDRLKSVFSQPHHIILDNVTLSNPQLAESALREFAASGKSIQFIYHGKTTVNNCALRRHVTDSGVRYDVSITVTGK